MDTKTPLHFSGECEGNSKVYVCLPDSGHKALWVFIFVGPGSV